MVDEGPLRYRNPLTDQFHYSPLGLLLRTDIGKTKGKYVEVEFPEVESSFYFKGVTYTPYIDYEPQPRIPLPCIYSVGPKILRDKFGMIFPPKEAVAFCINIGRRKSFDQTADWLENKKPVIPTHSNPLLAF